jgi:hypothetical protein
MANMTLRSWSIDALRLEWLEHLARHSTFAECLADNDIG